MPPVVAAIAQTLFAYGVAGVSTSIAIGQAVVAAVVGFGVQALSAALAPGAPKLRAAREQQLVTVRDPVRAREMVFGETRKGGVIIFMATTNDGTDLHMMIALAGHEVNAIQEIYYDEVLAFNSAGTIQSDFQDGGTDYAFLTKHLGAASQTADTGAIAALVDLTGVVSGATQADPVVITDVAHGLTTGDTIYPENVAGMTEINDREFRIDKLTDDTFELRDEDGTGHTAFSGAGIWERRPWTTAHRGREIAYTYNKLVFNRDIYNTIPRISVVMQGYEQVYDPRDTTFKYTANAALCQAAYLNHATYGLGAPYTTEIDDAALIAAANICDEAAVHPDGTETRFTLNGVVDSSVSPRRNIEQLLSANNGRMIYTGGMWVFKSAAHEVPTIEFDEGDLRSELTIPATTPSRDIFNAVRGVFIAEKTRYQPADFPPVKVTAYETEDNGERIWKDIELPFTDSETMAQRIARIFLESARREVRVSALYSLKALQVRAGDTIMQTLDRVSWTQKQFIISDWQFVIKEDDEGAPVMEIAMDLRETDSAVYDILAGDMTEMEDAPLATVDNPSGSIADFSYNVEDLAAGVDITPARSIRTSPQDETIISAKILSQGTPAGIDAGNTCVVTVYRNADVVVAETFDNVTIFPADGVSVSLGTLANTSFAEDDVLKIEVVNGVTADPPAFVLQTRSQEV